ncbi:MAG: hypothetical protein IPH95_19015 [Candidatus Promineofilum sp.]|nr:hypothetical protein [Promineifilum sp.]
MSDPIIDQLKEDERLKIDIPIEEDAPGAAKSAHASADLMEEFKRLGRQFGDTLQSAFNSEEARRMETELRAGMRTFADEVERVFHEAKDSPAASRVKEEATVVKERVETGDMGRKAQEGVVSGLRWLSTELEKLANQFTPAQQQPPTEKQPPTE